MQSEGPSEYWHVPNYNIEHCQTEGPNGGALIYIKNDIFYKVKNNLKIHQSEKLESVFTEIINSNNRNIVGCVYSHRSMEVNEFSRLFLNTFGENLLSDKQRNCLIGWFQHWFTKVWKRP